METYIAYFDILGFKEFIENRTKEEVDHFIGHIYRESQTAVSKGELVEISAGVAAGDLSKAKVNCMHFSDSIIFWSQDASPDNFLEMVDVCLAFYQTCMQASFPVRAAWSLGTLSLNLSKCQV